MESTANGVFAGYLGSLYDRLKKDVQNPVSQGLPDYYSTLMQGLALPGKAVAGVVGLGDTEALGRAFNTAGRASANPWDLPLLAGLSLGGQNVARLTGQADPITPWIDQLHGGNEATGALGQFIGTAAFDPMTYVGSGVTRAGLPLARLAPYEQALQTVTNKALLAPILIPKRVAEIPIPGLGLGRLFTRAAEDPATGVINNRVPTKSVGDYLWGGDSRPSLLNNFKRDLYDTVEHLLNRGHELGADMTDFQNALQGTLLPDARDLPEARRAFRSTAQDLANTLQNVASTHGAEANLIAQAVRERLTQAQQIHQANVAQVVGQSPQHIQQLVDQARLEHYQDMIRHMRAGQDVLGKLVDQAPGISTLETIQGMIGSRTDALRYLSQGRAGILADLPPQLQRRADVVFQTLANAGKSLQGDKEVIEQALEAAWNMQNARMGGRLGAYQPLSGLRGPADAVAAINQKLRAMGLQETSPTARDPFTTQFLDRVRGLIPGQDFMSLQNVVKSWGGGGDLLTGEPYRLVFDRAVRTRAAELGLDGGNLRSFTDPMNFLMTLWKSINVMSPNFLVQNAGGGALMSMLMGLNPASIGKNYGRNIATALRGENVTIPELAAQNQTLGSATTAATQSGSGFLSDSTQLRDLSGKGVDVLQKIGWLPMALMGAVGGGAAGYARAQDTPEDDTFSKTALGMGTGAIGMGTLPWLSRYVYQPLGKGTEDVLRQSALVHGREQFLQDSVEHGVRTVQQAFGQSLNSPVMQYGAQGTPDRIAQIMRDRGGQISAADLEAELLKDGVAIAPARQARLIWDGVLRGADEAGGHLSDSINFNYQKLTNLEEFLRQVLPFSTWGTKAIPFFANRIAEHPLIGVGLQNYLDMSQRQNEEMGLTPRFAGSVRAPMLDPLWGAMTGQEGKVFLNPRRGLMPFADTQRASGYSDQSETAYQALTRMLDTVGYSMHPAIDFAARLGGIAGTDAPRGLIRQGSPLEALTGIDLNAPFAAGERTIRQALGQETPENPRHAAILKRVDELALQETGRPIGSNDPAVAGYLDAKARMSGPIWNRARQQVERESGARALGGFVFQTGTPSAVLSPQEEQIRQARKWVLVPPEHSQAISAAASRDPNGLMDDNTRRVLESGARELMQRNHGGADLPPDVQALLQAGTWQAGLRLRNQILDAQGQTDPLLRGYTGSGSPEQQHLQNLIAAYRDPSAQLFHDQGWQSMTPLQRQNFLDYMDQMESTNPEFVRRARSATPNVIALQKKISDLRTAMTTENPILGDYMAWKKLNPGGDIDAFLGSRYSR